MYGSTQTLRAAALTGGAPIEPDDVGPRPRNREKRALYAERMETHLFSIALPLFL